jgi:hypothetical protein
MAHVYAAPIPPPEISTKELIDGSYDKIEREYIDKLATKARKNGKSPLLGEVIRFPRGDGYAQYLVWRTRPLELIWLEVGDSWSVEEALERGLRLTDVHSMVEAQKRIRQLFS